MKRLCYIGVLIIVLLSSCKKTDSNDIINRPLEQGILEVKPFPPTGPVSVKRYNLSTIDSSVSKELGGVGFEKDFWKIDGWETATDFPFEGDSSAVKGGVFRISLEGYPLSFRPVGKNAECPSYIYETLLSMDHNYNLIPLLASHWKISEDKKTFWFRLNPKAQFSDGKMVTADDILATHKLLIDDKILAPYTNELYQKFKVEKISPYIVKFTTNEVGFTNLLEIANLQVYPAHHLANVDGSSFMRKYQFDMMPGTGPYVLDPYKTRKGKMLVTRRRIDYWGNNLRQNIGRYNFDEIQEVVILDSKLKLEKFKKGDLDFYNIEEIPMWVKDFSLTDPSPGLGDALKRGLIAKRMVYNYAPQGFDGLWFNIRNAPFDDINIRKAFAMLYNRDLIVQKLEYGLKSSLSSFYPNSIYQNQNNRPIAYNPDEANKILDQAGWTMRDSEGYRKHPKRGILEITLNVRPEKTRYFIPFQQDLKKAGIKLNIKNADRPTLSQIATERRFQTFQYGGWGEQIPDPKALFHSKFADNQAGWSNLSGLKNGKIDSLITEYDLCFDSKQRVKFIKQIDSLAYNQHIMAFGYAVRHTITFAFWNHLGMPQGIMPINSESYDPTFWWLDQAKDKRLAEAKRDKTIQLEVGKTEINCRQNLK